MAFTGDVLLFLRKLMFWKKLCSVFQLQSHSSHAILPRTGILWGACGKMLTGMTEKCHLLKAIYQFFLHMLERSRVKQQLSPLWTTQPRCAILTNQRTHPIQVFPCITVCSIFSASVHIKKEQKQNKKSKPSRSVSPNNDRQYKCIFIRKQKRSGQALSHYAK